MTIDKKNITGIHGLYRLPGEVLNHRYIRIESSKLFY